MKQSDDNKMVPMTTFASGTGHEIRPDVYYFTDQIVNLMCVGDKSGWVLIDAGMPKSAEKIIDMAEKRFGEKGPSGIVLTHGHFDHIGSIVGLLEKWKVPVYAHPDEFPYLTGKQAYPEPDATVEGGLLAKLAFLYPHEPTDISEVLKPLPPDHTVPFLRGWEWIHTPGHTPGHVSFFRQSDKTLIAGDAFVTVRTDSFYKVLVQKADVNGPPRYLTTDWRAAFDSIKRLQALGPEAAITGHGPAMKGKELQEGLDKLVGNFTELAVPKHGKFVDEPGE